MRRGGRRTTIYSKYTRFSFSGLNPVSVSRIIGRGVAGIRFCPTLVNPAWALHLEFLLEIPGDLNSDPYTLPPLLGHLVDSLSSLDFWSPSSKGSTLRSLHSLRRLTVRPLLTGSSPVRTSLRLQEPLDFSRQRHPHYTFRVTLYDFSVYLLSVTFVVRLYQEDSSSESDPYPLVTVFGFTF